MTNLSELLPSGGGAKEFDAVASGTLTNGQVVALKTDGKVEAISTSSAAMSSGFNVDTDVPDTTSVVYVSSVDRVAIMYMNTNTTYPEAVIGQITGSSISFGTPQVITTDIQSVPVYGIYDENADRLVLFGSKDTYKYVGVVGTVTGGASNTSSWGALQTGGTLSQITKARTAVYMPDVQKCLLIIRENVGNGELKASSSTINPSTNTITWNGLQSIDATNGPGYNDYGVDVTYDSNYGVAIAAYNNGYSTTVKAVTIDVNSSGGTITIGTVRTLYSAGYFDCVAIDYDSKTQKCGLVTDAAGIGYMIGLYADSSTTLAQGNNGPYGLGGLFGGDPQGYIKSNGNNEFIYAYRYNASGTLKPNYWTLYIDSNNDLYNSSSSIDFGTAGDAGSFGIDYDTTAQKFVIAFHSAGTTDKNQAHLYNFTTTNVSDFIGITSEAIADTATGKVNPQGGVATTQLPLSAVYNNQSFSTASQDALPEEVRFKPDGTKFYILGATNDAVYQYSMSTAWDVSTASYESKSFSVQTQDTNPQGLAINADGTSFYMCGQSMSIYQYDLTTAYDASTASYASKSFSFSGQISGGVPWGIDFDSTGTKLYVIGSPGIAYQYTLSTAFDVSTASYASKSLDTTSQTSDSTSLALSSDGASLYVMSNGNDTVFKYTLSTPNDLATASYSGFSFTTTSQDTTPYGVAVKTDETQLYITGAQNDSVYQYSLSTSLTTGSTYYVQNDGTLTTTSSSVTAGKAISTTQLILNGAS